MNRKYNANLLIVSRYVRDKCERKQKSLSQGRAVYIANEAIYGIEWYVDGVESATVRLIEKKRIEWVSFKAIESTLKNDTSLLLNLDFKYTEQPKNLTFINVTSSLYFSSNYASIFTVYNLNFFKLILWKDIGIFIFYDSQQKMGISKYVQLSVSDICTGIIFATQNWHDKDNYT